jgi:hypothetical protein
MIAADVELASPEDARWTLRIEATSSDVGRLIVEIAFATEEEERRAADVLSRVCP